MKTLDDYLAAYQLSHQHPVNKLLHRICVPLISISLLGMLWSVPLPFVSDGRWANLFLLFVPMALVFYFRLSVRVGLVMSALAVLLGSVFLSLSGQLTLWPTSMIVFVLAWIGQFWGHKIEGKKPSFFQDLLFLLIGPLWVLRRSTKPSAPRAAS